MSTSACGNPQKAGDKDEGRESPGGGSKGEAGGSAAALQERGGNWLHQETEALLELWGRPDVQSEMLTTIRNMDIYNRIAAQMQQRLPNCARSGLQCRYRIKRLKRAYLRSKNDVGHRRTFPFFAQMEAALAERAKVAEQKERTGELSRKSGKKKKKSKSDKQRAAAAKGTGGEDAAGSSASALLLGPAEGAQIKIEIDNAEEYEYSASSMDQALVTRTLRGGRVARASSPAATAVPAAMVSAAPDSSGEEDDDDSGSSSSEEVKESVSGSVKKRSIGNGKRRPSMKERRSKESESDSDTVPLVIATDLGQIEDLEQHGQQQEPACDDTGSGRAAEAVANSPPLCTIESVYQMKDSEAVNGGPECNDGSNDAEDQTAKVGRKEKSRENSENSADSAFRSQGDDGMNKEGPQEPDTTNKTDSTDTKSRNMESSKCGEPVIRDSDVNESRTKSKEPHETLQEHEVSDLQIIAEWSVSRTSEADPLVDESVLIGEPPKKKKKQQSGASLSETLETQSPSVKPQIVLSPNLTIVAPTSSASIVAPTSSAPIVAPTSSASSSTIGSGTGPRVPRQRTFVRVLEKTEKDKEPSNATTGIGKSLLNKPGLSLLGSKSSALPVTFQPTAVRGASPRVIVYERPATGSSVTTSSPVVSSSSPGSPLAAPGVRIIRVPHSSPALSSVSVGIGGKVIRVADSGSASPVTSTPIARTQVTSSSADSRQAPLTFTTLSSLDPVPRRFILPREPLKVTYTSKTNPPKTTIVVPVTSASKQFTNKIVKSEGISERARPEPMRTIHIRPSLKRPNTDFKDETAEGSSDGKEAHESETKVAVHLKDLKKTGSDGSELIPLIMSAKDYGRLASSTGVFLNAGMADRSMTAARSGPQHRGREIIITSTPNRSPGHQNSSLLSSTDELSPSRNKVRIIEVSSSSTSSKPVLITRGGTLQSEPPVTVETTSLSAPACVQSKSSDNVTLSCGTVVTSLSNAQTESTSSSKDSARTSGLHYVTESSKILDGILAKLDKQVNASSASSSTLLITRPPECPSSAFSGDGALTANSNDDPTPRKEFVETARNDASPCLTEGGVASSVDAVGTRRQVVAVNTSSLSSRQEDDLFRTMLSQTTLTAECRAWMLRTLHSRSATPASTPTLSTSTTVAAEPAAVAALAGSPRAAARASELPLTREGATVEVTNLVVGDETSKTEKQTGTFKVKAGLAQMAKGGIIMDVTTPEEARIAEEAGACAVMALERVPADIRRQGGVARMTDPKKIKDIIAAVTIPVMAKCRIGHFAEAQILEALGVDMIDESEVLTPADEENHVDKHAFKVPFVCGARDLGEALRRVSEGAAMIRTKGDAGTGDVVEAVRHARAIKRQIKVAQTLDPTELYSYAKELRVPYDLLKKTAELGRLPVVNFAAGGLATPADVSLLMQLGVDGVFVGSGIFKSAEPPVRARAMAQAVTHYRDPQRMAALSEGLGDAMFGTPIHATGGSATTRRGDNSASGEQDKLWNATLALDKFRLSA